VECFFFVREADAALPHPILDLLPRSHAPQADAAAAPAAAATASELASAWALPTFSYTWALPNLNTEHTPSRSGGSTSIRQPQSFHKNSC
jgi:hypothetical protein